MYDSDLNLVAQFYITDIYLDFRNARRTEDDYLNRNK